MWIEQLQSCYASISLGSTILHANTCSAFSIDEIYPSWDAIVHNMQKTSLQHAGIHVFLPLSENTVRCAIILIKKTQLSGASERKKLPCRDTNLHITA